MYAVRDPLAKHLQRDPLAGRFTELNGGVNVHMHTCAPRFDISGTAGWIALKTGVSLERSQLYTLHRMGDTFSSARVTVHTF